MPGHILTQTDDQVAFLVEAQSWPLRFPMQRGASVSWHLFHTCTEETRVVMMTIYPALSPSHLFSQFAFYSSASQYTSVNILPQERFQKRKDLPLLLPTHASSLSLGISSVLFMFAAVSPRQGDAEERSFHIGKLWHFHSVSPQTGLLLLQTSDSYKSTHQLIYIYEYTAR